MARAKVCRSSSPPPQPWPWTPQSLRRMCWATATTTGRDVRTESFPGGFEPLRTTRDGDDPPSRPPLKSRVACVPPLTARKSTRLDVFARDSRAPSTASGHTWAPSSGFWTSDRRRGQRVEVCGKLLAFRTTPARHPFGGTPRRRCCHA